MRYLFLSLIILFGTQLSYTQENEEDEEIMILTQELPEVMLTATRTYRQLSSLPLPAQIIKPAEIKDINAIRLADLLNEQTGLITVSDFGGGEGVQLQGLDSQYTLILIDGVPLIGRSAGTLDLNRVSVGNIQQIEIVKGASSSLYGNDALGGVINIITEQPKTGFAGNLNHRSGSFNSNDTGLNLNYKKKALGLNMFINRFGSDGYDLNENDLLNTVESYSNYTINGKLTLDLNENTDLSLSSRLFTQDQDNVASEELSGESSIREWNVHLKLNHAFNSKWSSYFEFYTSRYKADEFLDQIDGTLISESNFNQFLMRPEIRSTFKLNDRTNFIGGLGMNHESLERTDFTTQPTFNSPYAFIQYDANLSDRINVILGARYDAHNEYQSQFSPKAAFRYKINDAFAVKASAGYGFKAPDFRQLYFDFSNSIVGYTILGYNAVSTALPELEEQGQIANIIVPVSEFQGQLSPENSIGLNLGIDFNPKKTLTFNINAFRNRINDLIDSRVIANKVNGQNVFSYYNVNSVYTQGIEFNGHWSPMTELKISGGYQLLYAKDKDAISDFENGEVFARESPTAPAFQLVRSDYFGLFNRSRHMANIKFFYTISKWKANTNIRGSYRSKYGLFDTNGNSYLDSYDNFVDGYSTWDVAFNKTLYENYEFGLGVDNVFDFKDVQNIGNIPGRIIYGTLSIQF